LPESSAPRPLCADLFTPYSLVAYGRLREFKRDIDLRCAALSLGTPRSAAFGGKTGGKPGYASRRTGRNRGGSGDRMPTLPRRLGVAIEVWREINRSQPGPRLNAANAQ
jgi:hypothetical protein